MPSNQEVLIVGIRIVNEETYFTSFKSKPNGITYETDFKKIDINGLIKEMKMIGL